MGGDVVSGGEVGEQPVLPVAEQVEPGHAGHPGQGRGEVEEGVRGGLPELARGGVVGGHVDERAVQVGAVLPVGPIVVGLDTEHAAQPAVPVGGHRGAGRPVGAQAGELLGHFLDGVAVVGDEVRRVGLQARDQLDHVLQVGRRRGSNVVHGMSLNGVRDRRERITALSGRVGDPVGQFDAFLLLTRSSRCLILSHYRG